MGCYLGLFLKAGLGGIHLVLFFCLFVCFFSFLNWALPRAMFLPRTMCKLSLPWPCTVLHTRCVSVSTNNNNNNNNNNNYVLNPQETDAPNREPMLLTFDTVIPKLPFLLWFCDASHHTWFCVNSLTGDNFLREDFTVATQTVEEPSSSHMETSLPAC